MNGVDISGFQLFLQDILLPWLSDSGIKVLGILVAVFIIKRILRAAVTRGVRKAVVGGEILSPEAERKREDTLIEIIVGAAGVAIWVVAAIMVLSEVGVDIGPLLAGAGIAGVAIGFGGQYLIRDLITGLFIIWENQYRVGDVVCFGTTCGTVEHVSLRITILRDMDGTVHTIPNGQITETANFSKEFARINLDLGISYDTPLEKAITVINQVGEELATDPEWKDKITEAPVFLRVNAFNDSSVEVKIFGEVAPLEQWAITGELRKRLKIAFDKEGIEIPFPQRVVHYPKET